MRHYLKKTLDLLGLSSVILMAGIVIYPYFAPAAEPRKTQPGMETIVLAGGCFWGVEAAFEHVTGVTQAVSGYAGGDADTAHYNVVSAGKTEHAEAVQVTYDPKQISLAQLLDIYFKVAHDPTQLNRQGPDHGTQYRSAVFPATQEQQKTVEAKIADLTQAQTFADPIETTLEPLKAFYPAEDYHQDFAARNPLYPYIVVNDRPKVTKLKKVFPSLYRE